MNEPLTRQVFDLELVFKSGRVEAHHVEGGRDTIAMDAERIKLTLKPEPNVLEEIIVDRREVVQMRLLARTVLVESTIEDRINERLTTVGAGLSTQ